MASKLPHQTVSPAKGPLERHRQLAPSAAIRVSPLCLGAMNFGEADKARVGECSKDTAFGILDHFFSQGGNFIDTAGGYQHGDSERWLGEWMASRNNRDEMVIATKYTTPYMKAHKEKIQSNFGGNGSKSMKLSLDASLKKLQTTYVDILYLHWWDFTITIPELMQSLNDLVHAGKVLYLGISDSPAWIVAKANQYARDHGLRQFVVYQGMWNAAIRDFEADIIPMCRDEGMALLPWASLGGGRFHTEEGYKEREKNNPGRQGKPYTAREKEVSEALEKIGKAKGTDVTSIALAYVRHKAPYVFPIVGGRKLEHIKGNIAALNVSLSEEDIKAIESAYEYDPGFPHTFLSGTMFTSGAQKGPDGPGDIWLTKMIANFDWVEAPKPIGLP
jgi:aryl-alcohol dehydrogenase-like predicted oxidoreductase